MSEWAVLNQGQGSPRNNAQFSPPPPLCSFCARTYMLLTDVSAPKRKPTTQWGCERRMWCFGEIYSQIYWYVCLFGFRNAPRNTPKIAKWHSLKKANLPDSFLNFGSNPAGRGDIFYVYWNLEMTQLNGEFPSGAMALRKPPVQFSYFRHWGEWKRKITHPHLFVNCTVDLNSQKWPGLSFLEMLNMWLKISAYALVFIPK